MMYGEAIRSSGKIISAVFNNRRKNVRREAEYRTTRRILLQEFPLDNPGGRGSGMGTEELNCLAKHSKICCYCSVAS